MKFPFLMISTGLLLFQINLVSAHAIANQQPLLGGPCAKKGACTLEADILSDPSKHGMMDHYHHNGNKEETIFLNMPGTTYKKDGNGIDLIASRKGATSYNCGDAGPCQFISAGITTTKDPDNPSEKVYWSTGNISHGYLSVLMQMPPCQTGAHQEQLCKGIWPTMSLMPVKQQTWPAGGLIDFMEYFPSNLPAYQGQSAIMCANGSIAVGGEVGFLQDPTEKFLSNSVHAYGLEWQVSPTNLIIRGYFDGNPQWSEIYPKGSPAYTSLVDDSHFNFYLRIKNLVGGTSAGAPDPNFSGDTLKVESITAWTVKDSK